MASPPEPARKTDAAVQPSRLLLEDCGVGWAPQRVAVFYSFVILVFIVVIGWIAPKEFEPTPAAKGLLLALLAGSVGVGYLLWKWMTITVTYKLDGSTLIISKGKPGRTPLRGFPKTYHLEKLWAAEVAGETREMQNQAYLTLRPKRLVLLFESSGGSRANQVELSRPSVQGDPAKAVELRKQLEPWEAICNRVQSHVLPGGLASRWQAASPYQRYRLLILQAELGFLKGPSTATRMCMVSLGFSGGSFRNVSKILKYAFGGIVAPMLLIGVLLNLSSLLRWIFGRDFGMEAALGILWDANGRLQPWMAWPLGACACIGVIIVVVSIFHPLSERLEQQDALRRKLADRLVGAGAKQGDFEPILKFVKDDQDRVTFENAQLTLITSIGTILGILQAFGTSSYIITAVATSILLPSQLWYSAQMRILRLAQTVCLIAQSQLSNDDEKSRLQSRA